MKAEQDFPGFDERFPALNHFILELVDLYNAGKISSWDDLAQHVNTFFMPDRMEQMDLAVPGWYKMASYSGGVTLVHVMCVFLGLFMLPEFQKLSGEQQQLAKWIVLFHDLEKEMTTGAGEKDKTHAFRAAGTTARELPRLGFPVTPIYQDLITAWSELTCTAITVSMDSSESIQDNKKLPEIMAGIFRMFGHNTPAALILRSVLLHMSITVVRDWPQAAPLTDVEITNYVDQDLLPLLKVMMLADNEGWSLFYPEERLKQRNETIETFEKVENLIS